MKANEFIKKFGWDWAIGLILKHKECYMPDVFDMWSEKLNDFVLVTKYASFEMADLKRYVDAYELVRPYMGSEDGQWFFIADYCKKNRISPFDSENYEKAKGIYLKAITLVEECQ